MSMLLLAARFSLLFEPTMMFTMKRLLFMMILAWLTPAILGVDISISRYEEGRKQFQLIEQHSSMPRYGQCWRNAMVTIQTGCKKLTDRAQARLALAYLNCFLEIQGRSGYSCSEDQDLDECMSQLREGDRGSLATFFTHTQSICYFLQAQIWQAETDNTVERLAQKSVQVTELLDSSFQLQKDMIVVQNQTLENQQRLLHQASNLSKDINSSSQSVQQLFEDLKRSTVEQTEIIGHVFDQLLKLQNTILGEVSGLYSFFYYCLSILVCYVLTSTARTSGARMWLFLIMTINFLLEQTLLRWFTSAVASVYDCDNNVCLYWMQKCCRHVSMLCALCVLCACAYLYRDINAVNNELLVEIRRQNSDIRKLISGSSSVPQEAKERMGQDGEPVSDSDYTSDDSEADTDKTFVLPENMTEVSNDNDSYCTVQDSTSKASLLGELHDLRQATPLRELSTSIHKWLKDCSSPDAFSPESCPTSGIADHQQGTPQRHSYNLRQRPRNSSTNTSPASRVESPSSFSRTVRHMQQIAQKNSELLRERLNNPSSPASSPGPQCNGSAQHTG
ncbi:uncharacterized protein LOC101863067 [Aplysia californica]|uniref:Uncharacterized protein LOC101863067 n=1 Tax=Aplysia californica TaxID=6500 RepID=A0ABM1VPU7_APLCA|nr:uncharacterized protein LOC101863067 [Aplysia californica]